MNIDIGDNQRELRTKLRNYFANLISPELYEQLRGAEAGATYKRVIKQMGTDGWLAIGWPKEYGGQGLSDADQLAFFEEALLGGAPIPFVTLNTVGPALMSYGSEEQKAEFLPKIASGDIHFSIGYSEPEAGTDLAVLNTMAVEDGDYYVINGSKMWTSAAEGADYIWLATRTEADTRHKGITMFIVDAKDPGFSYAHIKTVGNVGTNMTYYENVRVHKSMMVGGLNKGWGLIMSQLNHERVGLAAWGIHGWKLYKRTLDWARQNHNGSRPIDEPSVQRNLAEAYTRLEAMRLLNARMAWELEQDRLDPGLAGGVKVFSTEGLVEIVRLLMEVCGPDSLVKAGSSAAILMGDLEQEYRRSQINTFGGGVNEIQRGLVATFGLGMPRHR
jgi:alkylation response protein AidB-like acyl-CoA dehydrogenase